jgi:hypothetical protein
MSDAVNVQTIVARLNDEPFEKELSLVSPATADAQNPATVSRGQAATLFPPGLLRSSLARALSRSVQVTFDELTPVELLQLLNDVLAFLDEAHKVDVRYEAPEVAGPRITGFLAVLRFTIPKDPAQL